MKQKILFVISLLFGLMFINAGLNKFFNYMPMPEDMPESSMKIFAAFMQITWLMPLIGIAEIIGGVLVIIPKTRALGAVIMFPITLGILCHHLVLEPDSAAIAIVLMLINLWILFENRHKYSPMVTK